jgi:hypothetical protein
LLATLNDSHTLSIEDGYSARIVAREGQNHSDCVEYGVDLEAAARMVRVPKVRHQGKDVLIYTNSWLWLPAESESNTDIELSFILPEGVAVSTPWQLIERAPRHTLYRTSMTQQHTTALMAMGHFTVAAIEVPGSRLRLGILNGAPPVKTDEIQAWIRHGARAVAGLYGRFPQPSPQILVVPIGPRSEAVPWGQVLRGGSPAAHLFIDQTRPLEAFIDDWTLVHELSHLVLPSIHHSEPWLYEGIATYYQNVLRARSAVLSEQEAWQKLHEGFQRGIRQTRSGITLEEASRSMMRERAFMRVYWSGTAIALLADLELRQRNQSLDQALSALRQCCLASNRKWTGTEIMQKLDELTHTEVFSGLYEAHIRSDAFPDLDSAYQQLGLVVNRGDIQFAESAPLAQIRKAITSKAY